MFGLLRALGHWSSSSYPGDVFHIESHALASGDIEVSHVPGGNALTFTVDAQIVVTNGADRRMEILVQTAQLLADEAGISTRLKGNLPSLGWGNIQEDLFNATRVNHRAGLGGIEWRDLILDDSLAIRVTAFALRDLQDEVAATAPAAMIERYSTMGLAAAAYNIGMGNLEDAYAAGQLGPLGTSYSSAVMRRFYGAADSAICNIGPAIC